MSLVFILRLYHINQLQYHCYQTHHPIYTFKTHLIPMNSGTCKMETALTLLLHHLSYWFTISDVPGLAWPESPGLGLALEGSGLVKPQARPYKRAWAWLGPGSGPGQGLFRPGLGPGLRAQARAYETKYEKHLNYTVFDLSSEVPHRDPQRTRSKFMRI